MGQENGATNLRDGRKIIRMENKVMYCLHFILLRRLCMAIVSLGEMDPHIMVFM